MERYVNGVRQLGMLVNKTRAELSLNEMITLSELNEQFNSEISGLRVNAELLNNEVHHRLLNMKVEPRQIGERRSFVERRVIKR